jgi:hypothetical protein
MPLSEVSIVDGRFGRPVGTAIVWADAPRAAVHAVEQVHEGETSYGEPFVVTEARPYEPDAPTVIIVNYA